MSSGPVIRLDVWFGEGPGKRFLNVEYPFDGTPEDFDAALELVRVSIHGRASEPARPDDYPARPDDYTGPWWEPDGWRLTA